MGDCTQTSSLCPSKFQLGTNPTSRAEQAAVAGQLALAKKKVKDYKLAVKVCEDVR